MIDQDLVSEAPAVNYSTAHSYLRRHFAKTGQCVQCSARRRTEFALKHGKTYSRDRDDYSELCVPCHRRYDGTPRGEQHGQAKLTEAIVVEARLLYGTGRHTQLALAQKYGVSQPGMRKAIRGITWKHARADALLARADSIFDAVERLAA